MSALKNHFVVAKVVDNIKNCSELEMPDSLTDGVAVYDIPEKDLRITIGYYLVDVRYAGQLILSVNKDLDEEYYDTIVQTLKNRVERQIQASIDDFLKE